MKSSNKTNGGDTWYWLLIEFVDKANECHSIVFQLLFVLYCLFSSIGALDTITRTSFISDREYGSVVSSDGSFKLGFFSPGKSQARYVGIWFNRISEQTFIWVANREAPFKSSEGVFRIDVDGNLAVFVGKQRSPVWSTNVSVRTGNSTAKLLDTGNLVLVSEERIIWQSFDYPTDTILPAMKFGLNKKTGLNHVITSWKSADDPSPGEFSSRLDPDGIPQFFLYKNSGPYWRGGPYNGRNMNGVPDVSTRIRGRKDQYTNQIDLVNYTFADNENESYLAISSKNRNTTVWTMIVLEPMGTMKRLILDDSNKWAKLWMAPTDMCDEYDRCIANEICIDENVVHCACLPGFRPSYSQDLYLRCAETRKINGCGKGVGEGFIRIEAVKLPDARNSTFQGHMNLEECKRACLKSCNCTGYAILDVIGSAGRCLTWYSELRDMRHYQDGQDFYHRVDAVELGMFTFFLVICILPATLPVWDDFYKQTFAFLDSKEGFNSI